MKKLLFAVVATVMVSGLLLGSMGSDVFALSERGAEKGEAKGCDKDNPNQAKNNPHCEVSECTEVVSWYHDHDGDGYGSPEERIFSCIDGSELPPPPAGAKWVMNNDDCNDDDPLVWNTCD